MLSVVEDLVSELPVIPSHPSTVLAMTHLQFVFPLRGQHLCPSSEVCSQAPTLSASQGA